MIISDTQTAYRLLERRLRQLRRRLLVTRIAAAAMAATWAAAIAALSWVVAEAVLYLPPVLRTAWGVLVPAAGIATACRCLWSLPGELDTQALALRAEAGCAQLRQRLITALQLWPRRDQDPYSRSLLAASVREASRIFAAVGLGDLIDAGPLRRQARWLGLALAACALGGLTLGDALFPAIGRCAHPTATYLRPVRTHIEVMPGNMEVVRGDDAEIAIHLSGSLPPTAQILRREGEAAPWLHDEIVVDGRSDTLYYTFEAAQRAFEYRVRAGDGETPAYAVDVIPPPVVQRLRLTFTYPAYSGLPPRVEAESGDIRALTGTTIGVDIRASKPLAEAGIVFDHGGSQSRRLPARVEDNAASATWTLSAPGQEPGSYQIDLIDGRGIRNRDPIRYAIQVVGDALPQVAITDPGRDTDLSESGEVFVAVEAADDFGVTNIDLVYRVNEGGERRFAMAMSPGRDVRASQLWDLSGAGLMPEDRVYYHAEVRDNDLVTGPKTALSHQYVLRFPSLYELLEEVAEEQVQHQEGLEELAAQEDEARQYLEQLRREVLKTDELSWEQKRELEATLKAEEERAQAVSELAEKVAETAAKLEEHGLASGEILEKLEEIRELMGAIASPDLQEALAALQEGLDQMSPEELAQALEEFSKDQQAFEERLDRTLALLRQVFAEQRLQAVVEEAADLLARQSRIDADLEEATGDQISHSREQESAMERDTERLHAALEELSRDLEPISQSTSEGLQAAAQQMEEGDLTGRMNQMIQHLEARNPTPAQRLGEGLEEDLGVLSADLQYLQGQFNAQQKDQLGREMRQAMGDLLHLSLRQEELGSRTEQVQAPGAADLAVRQFALQQGVSRVVERVADLGQRTFTLSFGLPATLGYALRNMQQSGLLLGQREPAASLRHQEFAMRYLNEAVLLLRESIDSLAQAATPTGFAEAMQKLMGLSQQQADLNQATQQSLEPGMQPGSAGWGMEQQRQMARLAARQRQIYQALSELGREVRGHRGLEKRVQVIQEQMAAVLRDLEQRRPHPRVVRAQKQILQRLLEASQSIHARGFEEKRRSESGTAHGYVGPEWLPSNLGQSPDALREAMLRALSGDYPGEYRSLIRRYYERVYDDVTAGRGGDRP